MTVKGMWRRAWGRVSTPVSDFHSSAYLAHNQRRQEHLASLGLDIAGATVHETGAGLGDHTSFFLDRGCHVIVSEARERNLRALRKRLPGIDVRQLDLDNPAGDFIADVAYCYGTLYHLSNPKAALGFLADNTTRLLLLETAVSADGGDHLNPTREPRDRFSQAVSGIGCRPTREWVWNRLTEHFPHVYATVTQPWHHEFPLDWSDTQSHAPLTRAVFVASRAPLEIPTLTSSLPATQTRH
jgi:hypothetical protein